MRSYHSNLPPEKFDSIVGPFLVEKLDELKKKNKCEEKIEAYESKTKQGQIIIFFIILKIAHFVICLDSSFSSAREMELKKQLRDSQTQSEMLRIQLQEFKDRLKVQVNFLSFEYYEQLSRKSFSDFLGKDFFVLISAALI